MEPGLEGKLACMSWDPAKQVVGRTFIVDGGHILHRS